MAATSAPGTMQAVVFKEPFKVAVEQRPIPTVQYPEDIVVKVKYTALCGRCVPRYLGGINALTPVFKLVIYMFTVALSPAPQAQLWATSLWVKLSKLVVR